MNCPKCSFSSTITKLYKVVEPTTPADEIKPGRPASSLNNAVSNAVTNSSIGVAQFREIMLRMGIDPGSTTGLQNLMSRHSNPTMTRLGETNMFEERSKLKKKFPEGISISVDGRYNTAQNSKTPFQAASQMVFSVTENNTEDKKVIHVQLESKICSTKFRRQLAGKDATCPNHKGCTATLKPSDSIGLESRPAFKSALVMKAENVSILDVTNDGDTEMISAWREVFGIHVESLKDPAHLSRSQKRYVQTTPFSETMFPGTKAIRDRQRKWFSEDLRQRCSAELTECIKEAGRTGSKDRDFLINCILQQLKDTPDAIIKCYKGDHTKCKEVSKVCSKEEGKLWPKLFVPQALKPGMEMEEGDADCLDLLIGRRLGKNAIDVTYKGTTTQKNEAANRSFTKYNPKTVTFSRNWSGRIHASVLNLNAGFAEAVRQTVQAAGHKISESVQRRIDARDKRIKYQATYQKKVFVKRRRVRKQASWNPLHEIKYPHAKVHDLGYSKGCDLPPSTCRNPVAGSSKSPS